MKRVYLYVFITAFLFGTMEVALKLAVSGMDSYQLTFLRFMIGGLILLPFGIVEMKKNNTHLTMKDLGYLLIVGIVGIPMSMLLFQFGVVYCNASTASVLICTNPLFTMVFAHFMAGEKFTTRKAVIILFGLIGLFFMIKPWDLQEGNSLFGIICMVVSAILFALYTVLGKKSVAKVGAFAQTSISFILGSLVLLLVMVPLGHPVFKGVVENWISVLSIGVFVTGLGYLCYFLAIKYSNATTGSMAFFIKPAIAPVIAVIVLHETIMWNTVAGIIFILISSYLNMQSGRKAAALNEKNNA